MLYNVAMIEIKIEKNDGGQRLDRFLRKYYGKASLGYIYKLIRKDVKLNGRRATVETFLTQGDLLQIYLTEAESDKIRTQAKSYKTKRQFTIAYEDQRVLIAIKPVGLLTHGDAIEKKETLANQVCGYLISKGEYMPGKEQSFVPAPVNRLDRNTSGLVIFGKDADITKEINALLRDRTQIQKYYKALVVGELKEEFFLRDHMHKDEELNKVEITTDGKLMETMVTPIKWGGGYSLVEVRLLTGRTHQIRVHLASIGHPIIGDSKYGDRSKNASAKSRYGISTQLLHGSKLNFKAGHLEGKTIEGALPIKFQEIVDDLFDKK